MKNITKYLFENLIPIFESCLQAADYTKHDFKYAKGVINDLLNSDVILLGNHGETEHHLDPIEQEEFKSQYNPNNFPKTKKNLMQLPQNINHFQNGTIYLKVSILEKV